MFERLTLFFLEISKMLVTALYDIQGGSDNFSIYVQRWQRLMALNLPIVTFVPRGFGDQEATPAPTDCQHIIELPLEEVHTYQRIVSRATRPPRSDNSKKDTIAFVALQNSKIEFVQRAMDLFPDVNVFAWIDAGIMKIVRNPKNVITSLGAIQQYHGANALFPTLWGKEQTLHYVQHRFATTNERVFAESILWRFCGGYFMCPRAAIIELRRASDREIDALLEQGLCTWEVNIWTLAERRGWPANTYHADDHNDSMFMWPIPQK